MSLRTNQKGFTIVELLIVVVVIAILAAISIVAFTGVQARARASSAASLASQLAKKADTFYAVNNSYPTGTTTALLQTSFNGTSESSLEGLALVYQAAAPASASAAATAATSAWTEGKTVIYVPSSTGYSIFYWTNETAVAGNVVAANLARIQKT